MNLFVPDGVIVVTKGLHRSEETVRADPKASLSKRFPIIVLVNEHSASAAEIVAGSLSDNHRALILGTRSFGKGSVQEVIPLEKDEGEVKLTVAYYYLPSGRLVHRKKGATDWGVEPQINVPVSEKVEAQIYQQQGEDELFHKPLPLTPSTRSSTQPATVIDVQLQEAINTMVGSIAKYGDDQLVPTTQPTTQVSTAATQPAAH